MGSSPRVRGAAEKLKVERVVAGIIPARAGSSLFQAFFAAFAWDHPRACGEQSS